jgi:hypothetical protein
MEFTRTVDNITARNLMHKEGGWLRVQLPNSHPITPKSFVYNASDIELVAPTVAD